MDFDKELCNPALEDWPDLIGLNKRAAAGSGAYSELRRRTAALAAAYTENLNALAKSLLRQEIVSEISELNGQDIVLSGHQPEIYHPGVLYKFFKLEEYRRKSGCFALNIILDTDEGDAGHIVYPLILDGKPSKKSSPLLKGKKPFRSHMLPPAEELKDLFGEAQGSLTDPRFADLAESLKKYCSYYIKLAGRPIVEAHTIVRRIFENSPGYLEIPFSQVLRLEEANEFFLKIVFDFENFFHTYNSLLDKYRRDHRIKNSANPFPNLTERDGYREMPLWVHEGDSRRALFVKRKGREVVFSEPVNSSSLIVPKASLTTTFFRVCLSDLFIHGLGGAKYDRFTDQLMEEYFGIEPPIYATASADKYIFRDEIIQYEEAKAEAKNRRYINYHVEKYFPSFNWPGDEKSKLGELLNKKEALVGRIIGAKEEGRSSADLTNEMKGIDRQIREILDRNIGPLQELPDRGKTYRDIIYSRDFSYFLFG